MLNNTELDQIAAGTFSLDFVEATLTQQKKVNPDIYHGSATIVQDGNKNLSFKLLGTLKSDKRLSDQMMEALNNESIPGKLISRESYYRFFGIDMSGKAWTAEDISITTATNMNHGGKVICSQRLREIRSTCDPVSVENSKHKLIIPGKFKIPFTETQPETNERGLTKCTIPLENGSHITIKSIKDNLIFIITTDNLATESYKNRVLEAVGIAVGSHFSPQVEMIRSATQHEIVVRSAQPKHVADLRLVSPIQKYGSSGFPDFKKFIQCYLNSYNEPFHQVAGLWFRVLHGFDSTLENQGLILATACEGIVNAEFHKESKPELDFIKQLEEAKPLVESLNIQSRAKDRIIQSLSSGKNSTMANALRSLEESEKIPKNLRNSWRNLRNKLAHANELEWGDEQDQKFINAIYSCLELFYRLIMIRIKYEGSVIAFSKEGWPLEPYFQFKSH